MGSKIEWTDETWNPVTGCTKVSPGCDHCYAERVTERFGRGPFSEVRLHPDRLDQPLRWKKPRRIFVVSMGDLFHPRVPWPFVAEVFWTMASAPRHTFQVLTKRPGRMAYFADKVLPEAMERWPANVWAGTSVESAKYLPRLKLLAKVPAAVRFVSAEPLLSALDLRPWLRWEDLDAIPVDMRGQMKALANGVNWVVAGGESGPGARPMHPQWVREIRDQCQAADVPFFFKQWGEYGPVGPDHRPAVVDFADGPVIGMARIGKRAAGAVLDGREWREMPGGQP